MYGIVTVQVQRRFELFIAARLRTHGGPACWQKRTILRHGPRCRACHCDFNGLNVRAAQIVSGRPCFRQRLAATGLGSCDQRYEVGRYCFRRGRRRSQARGQGCPSPLSQRRRMVVFSLPCLRSPCARSQASREAVVSFAAVSAKGLDIAYPAARPSSAMSRGWRGSRSCASCSTAGR
jgi:hypothetical protein